MSIPWCRSWQWWWWWWWWWWQWWQCWWGNPAEGGNFMLDDSDDSDDKDDDNIDAWLPTVAIRSVRLSGSYHLHLHTLHCKMRNTKCIIVYTLHYKMHVKLKCTLHYKMHHCMQCKIQKGEVIRELSLVGRLLASAVKCIHCKNALKYALQNVSHCIRCEMHPWHKCIIVCNVM